MTRVLDLISHVLLLRTWKYFECSLISLLESLTKPRLPAITRGSFTSGCYYKNKWKHPFWIMFVLTRLPYLRCCKERVSTWVRPTQRGIDRLRSSKIWTALYFWNWLIVSWNFCDVSSFNLRNVWDAYLFV